MYSTLLFIFLIILAYLIGSLCSAVIVSNIFKLPDPRIHGSNNPGATNVLRLAGKKYAAIVLIADMLKGLIPVLIGHAFNASAETLGYTCFAAVFGHMYPLFFKFKGGKGVATALGAFLGFHLMMGAFLIATWILVANISKYSSLASLIVILFAPFYSLFFVGNSSALLPLLLIAIFVLYKHRNNISRLVDGEEPKINLRKIKEQIKKEVKSTNSDD